MVYPSSGNLTIVIPRLVLDKLDPNGKDDSFGILGNRPVGFNESSTTPNSRSLVINFDRGANYIQILGTKALKPEVQLTIPRGASEQGHVPFEPDVLTLKTGDNVILTNKDSIPHTVTSGSGPEDKNKG